MTNLFVVSAIGQQQLFILAKKFRRICQALIPQQNQPAAGFQDAKEFTPGRCAIKPVSGLRSGDEVDAMIGKSCCFGRPGNTDEVRERREQTFSGVSHLGIGLDAEDWVAILEQHACPDAGARGDIGNDATRRKTAFGPEGLQDFSGIAGTVSNIILNTIGKAAGSVGSRHGI